MNEPTNAPMFDSTPPAPEPFYQTWIKALTKPNEQTYAEIANSPDASPNKAYLWIFLVSLITSFLSSIVNLLAGNSFSQISGVDYAGVSPLISVICGAPIASALSVLLFALGVAIVQWVASLFGGTGTYNKLVYVVAAYAAPFGLITGIIGSIVGLIPYVGLCFYFLIVGVSLFLEITAVKAVNGFDWGKAVMSVLIPFFVILFVCGCLVIGGLMLLGPVIGDVFSTINSSLGY